MKVLVLANNDVGLYHFRKELLVELLHPGTFVQNPILEPNEVFISLPRGPLIPKLIELGCKYIETPVDRRGVNPVKDLKLLIRYNKIIKEIRPDIVLTYTIKPNIYGGIICRRQSVLYIANVTGLGTSIENGGLMSRIILWMYKVGLKSANAVFFQNKKNREFFEEKEIVSENGKSIPGSGVNLTEHSFEEYPQDNGKLKFLFVGRIMKDKGIGEFLDCAEYIKSNYPHTEFDILGGFDDDTFRKRMAELNDKGIVHYYGRCDDVHGFMKTHHATVLPSYHEGLSNVLLESSAAGRPVITTNVPGCAETFDDGISGIGFESKSSKALIEAVEKYIAMDYEAKKIMGLKAREKVEREFDKRIVINSYLNAINEII